VFQVEDPPLVDSRPPAAGEVAALRASLGLDASPVVLYSGNFEPYQGVDLLLDAAALVEGARFVFMGGEPAEIESARARAAARGTLDRVLFTGKRPPSDLPAFLALADVLASPRRKGANTPFKVYTYLSSGRPIVATRIASHTQVLDDTNAWLVDVTVEGLAAGVRAVLADPTEAARRAENGRALLEREYSPARYAEKVRAAYAHVATAVRGRA
jgi:glycosyltransferase involved in cell wall biosynthesis